MASHGNSSSLFINIFTIRTEISRSLSLNSYALLKPKGPNFRLSCTIAWKNDNENNKFLNSLPLLMDSAYWKADPNSTNERLRLAFKPLGGSVVNFIPFYNTLTGKYEAGIEVRNIRNWGFNWISFIRSTNYYNIYSMDDIHDLARWQFCSNTQNPSFYALSINNSAFLP